MKAVGNVNVILCFDLVLAKVVRGQPASREKAGLGSVCCILESFPSEMLF